MEKLEKMIVENGITYVLGEDDIYYPNLQLPEGVNVNIKMFKKWKIKMYILFHSVFRLAVKKCSLFLKPV